MALTPPPPAAIVIAGGRSTRFGSDKLLAEVGGRTLLERTMRAVSACAPIALVSGADASVASGVVTVSEYPRWGGPCAAIAAGLAALGSDVGDALILAADLAHPEAAVAALLAIGSGVLADRSGQPQWLLARTPVAALRDRVAELEAAGGAAGKPARAIIGELGLRRVTADADAIADIDVPDDLDQMAQTGRRRPDDADQMTSTE